MRALKTISGVCFVAATLCTALVAHAGDTYCGAVGAGWNVPNGAAAFTRSPGPISAVLTAVGEYRSHSLLSNGPGWYVTHATSKTPPSTSADNAYAPYWTPFCSSCGNVCWNPIDPNFLYHSTPGMEQVMNGAIYAFIYLSGGNNFIAYQNGKPWGVDYATTVGNFSWWGGSNGIGFNWNTSADNSAQGYYGVTYNSQQIYYGWYQYMNSEGAAAGIPGRNNGIVCSSALALWQHDGVPAYGDVLPRSYGPSVISPAASALWNAVYNECYSQNGWFASLGSFFQSLGTVALCGDGNLCDEAADQMANCFAAGHCGDPRDPDYYNDGEWHGIVSYQTARAISPDDVSCWNGNGTGAPCSGTGSSIWGYDINQTVQWNSGGYNYSCWD